MNNSLSQFTGLYSLSKTLRFELIPQGKTLENMHSLIAQDEQRAKDYQQVKKIIDDYHKHFIDEALANVKLENLQQYYDLYVKRGKSDDDKKQLDNSIVNNVITMGKSDKDKKQLDNIKTELRKNLIAAVKINEKFKNIFKEELIKKDLVKWLETQPSRQENEIEVIKKFSGFTTYFAGFHKNRENMYSDEDKSTSIAFRLIHQNLPKFIDNLLIFEKIKSSTIDLSPLSLLLGGTSLDDFFQIEYFKHTLTQTGIEFYNLILGGKNNDDGTKLHGLNELINLYNQQQADKKNRLPKLKPLFKQILSDREGHSFVLAGFKNDGDVCETIHEYYASLNNSESIFTRILSMFCHINEHDTKQIYINKSALTNLSTKIYGNWDVIGKALEYHYITQIDTKSNRTQASIKKKEAWLKQECFSIKFLEQVIQHYITNQQLEYTTTPLTITEYFAQLFASEDNLISQIINQYPIVATIINTVQADNKNLIQAKDNVAEIKKLLDSIIELLHLCKTFVIKSDIAEKEHHFYSELEYCLEHLNPIIPLYNQTRNYLTQKPYSLEKFKLNFENATLLDGWDRNKETSNTSVLLRKDGCYYLGIMNKKHNRIFETIPQIAETNNSYEKIVYKLLPGANKMLPKVFLSTKGKATFKPSPEILANYAQESHKKGDTFDLDACHQLIDYFKDSINKHSDWKNFDFNFSATNTYEDISGFYREVESQGYKITFDTVPEQYINELVDTGKLYLFQIYNKDFSPHSTGTPNMHTMYWKALFSEENLANVVYKLNGQAEIFYRKKSIADDKTIIHPANQPINNKNADNTKQQSTFTYDLIKDKRFTMDKFQFHVPITLNFKASGRDDINLEVKEYLKTNPQTHVIGIDRGERHLLYVSVVNPQGEIIEQFSLNEIINEYKGNTYKVDYHNLLNQKGGDRLENRKNWGVVENIKELKEGYLSQVIHKICQLIIKYQAIVVMEDLNSGFKNSRIKVEKQIYQKFEKMLIDKLQYLAFKKPQDNQPSIYNALQLASKFESFQKLGTQSGFIFYVPAWNTSKIDPATGFVDLLKPKYETVAKAQEFICKFDEIKYNPNKDWFEFSFDYSKFTEKADGTRLDWTVCTTNIPRYSWNRQLNNGKGDQQLFEITKCLKSLFDSAKIKYQTSANLIEQIAAQTDKDFYVCLLKYLSITLNLRHNNGKSGADEEDYILSPVADETGSFFDSRVELAKGKDEHGNWVAKLPVDADANGAYHIAKKGLWVLQQLQIAENLKKVKLAISNKEWLKFTQN